MMYNNIIVRLSVIASLPCKVVQKVSTDNI